MRIAFHIDDEVLRSHFRTICREVTTAGGRALLVGGSVRDAALGFPVRDLDIEVYGFPPSRIRELLSKQFRLDLVGRAFPVLKVHDLPIDISIPWPRSAGLEAGELDDLWDPRVSVEEAASRRDFTMNAMALDPETQELIDPLGGFQDLGAKVLRHTSDKFGEDPLRVLRGMQLAARFDLTVAPETVEVCRLLSSQGLATERIFEEWKKLILRGRRPSRGLGFLRDSGWLRDYPELEALIGCRQEPDWHPEGDVWIHTLHCMDAFAGERIGHDEEDLIVGLGVLCHDVGKPATTRIERDRITSQGHEPAGEGPTRSFLERLTHQQGLIEAVVPLVMTHLRPQALYDARAGDSAIRRLARHAGRIDRLVRVARCDQMGRPPRVFDGFPAGEWLLTRARALEVEQAAPKPLVMGRHLLDLGLPTGPRVGRILEACYEAQLDGAFSTVEMGIEYAKRVIEKG